MVYASTGAVAFPPSCLSRNAHMSSFAFVLELTGGRRDRICRLFD